MSKCSVLVRDSLQYVAWFGQNFWKHQKGRKKEDICKIILSDYVKRLKSHVKQKYLEKISPVGINPATLIDAKLDPQCLPPIEATDFLFYLVIDTERVIIQRNSSKLSKAWRPTTRWFRMADQARFRKDEKNDNLIYVQRESQLTY